MKNLIGVMNFRKFFFVFWNFFSPSSIFDYNFWSRESVRNTSLVKWRGKMERKGKWKRGQCNYPEKPVREYRKKKKPWCSFQLEDVRLRATQVVPEEANVFSKPCLCPKQRKFSQGSRSDERNRWVSLSPLLRTANCPSW